MIGKQDSGFPDVRLGVRNTKNLDGAVEGKRVRFGRHLQESAPVHSREWREWRWEDGDGEVRAAGSAAYFLAAF